MSSKKSRSERLWSEMFEGRELDTDAERDKDREARVCESFIESENQKFWALYRALNVSQRDVKDLVDPMVETSQSSVSRIIRQKDDDVVCDSEALSLSGKVHSDEIDTHADEWIEAYRDVLAEAKADVLALRVISDAEQKTPEWAARRFPKLVGYHHYWERQMPNDIEKADDSHLNHLESVNTDRWK